MRALAVLAVALAALVLVAAPASAARGIIVTKPGSGMAGGRLVACSAAEPGVRDGCTAEPGSVGTGGAGAEVGHGPDGARAAIDERELTTGADWDYRVADHGGNGGVSVFAQDVDGNGGLDRVALGAVAFNPLATGGAADIATGGEITVGDAGVGATAGQGGSIAIDHEGVQVAGGGGGGAGVAIGEEGVQFADGSGAAFVSLNGLPPGVPVEDGFAGASGFFGHSQGGTVGPCAFVFSKGAGTGACAPTPP